MASELVFDHSGWEVATSSWTAAAKPGKAVELRYAWGSEAMSTVTLPIFMDQFVRLTSQGHQVDFRPMQRNLGSERADGNGPRR